MKGLALNSWENVRAELLRRISQRQWRPGDAIPNENDLAREFGCARATVNRALRDLAEAGLVERRRKAGSRVALTPVRKATLAIPVIRREVESRGQAYRFAMVENRLMPAPDLVASRLGLAPAQPLLHLRTIHFADGQPFAHEDRWLNPHILPDGAHPDFGGLSVNEWLVRNVAYAAGDIAFSAQTGSPEETRALAVPAGSALFIVERTTRMADMPVTFVRLAYPPGYRMQTTL